MCHASGDLFILAGIACAVSWSIIGGIEIDEAYLWLPWVFFQKRMTRYSSDTHLQGAICLCLA